ncbi:MAG: hypothetical protein BGO12_16445 [Verrucomicrobia bacterium 61-8]|nr:hypothetical protein [Verrucomicrobiota bacterium]OJV16144.1 MAG: hypothetical protein BGO12_16445 [Verrucomicrobia bacterium 61-8]
MFLLSLGCQRQPEVTKTPSPDGRYLAIVSRDDVESATRIADLRDGSVRKLTSQHRRFDYQVRWKSPVILIVESSDIGSTGFRLGNDNRWEQIDPLVTISPDGRLAAKVWWSGTGKTINIDVCEYDGERISSFIQTISTSIAVDELVGCFEWASNDDIVVHGEHGAVHLRKDARGTWSAK